MRDSLGHVGVPRRAWAQRSRTVVSGLWWMWVKASVWGASHAAGARLHLERDGQRQCSSDYGISHKEGLSGCSWLHFNTPARGGLMMQRTHSAGLKGG